MQLSELHRFFLMTICGDHTPLYSPSNARCRDM